MAHESFEDAETAAFMNEHFINIKVDREERPDLDAIYMGATVAMTGSGGWPLSVFLTPDLKPFYTGTYFPPVPRHNLPSFMDVLTGIARAWREEQGEIIKVGGQVTQHLQQAMASQKSDVSFNLEHLRMLVNKIIESYDWGYGGWGTAPKFPQPMTIEFLLRRSVHPSTALGLDTVGRTPTYPSTSSGHRPTTSSAHIVPAYFRENDETLKPALHALKSMARGGMYDVVGGGFSRYSTDNFWRVPHFEKMLYDNAQLALVYLHAWQITKEPFYKQIVIETLDFIGREMTHPNGGFYSSLDADSEGEEGKFYVWSLDEIRAALKDDAEFFEAAYGITLKGNWEGQTVLQRTLDDAPLAARFKLDLETVSVKLADCHSRLLSVRAARTPGGPGTDDKILTAWNGLMLHAFAESARALDNKGKATSYLIVATRNAEFLLTHLRYEGRLCRSWRDGQVTREVFLEDYAALVIGLLELYQTDFNNKWFTSARQLADEMIARFSDPSGGFFDTPNDGERLLIRPKDIQDNATPSGNALACEALLKLAALTGKGKYRDLAEKALGIVTDFALRYPTGFARWLSAADFAQNNEKQIAVLYEAMDEKAEALIQVIRSEYRPNVVVAASKVPPSDDAPELLKGRPLVGNRASVYVCEGFVCLQPTTDADDLQKKL